MILDGSSIFTMLSSLTSNFFPTYGFPISEERDSPRIVKIKPETVWSCFRTNDTKACID